MTDEIKYKIEVDTVEMLRSVFDPEIPVNVYDLGLIYKIEVVESPADTDKADINVDMTLTAPNCPAAEFIMMDIQEKLESIKNVSKVNVNLVFEPEWTKDMMSEEARLDLGLM
ncbi:MAG: iron-sulfur cluster assembly protein [Bacteroidales bacterium]|nr:iron-sulfur cluster assembly protein [Bacteroidales bacterium]